MTKVKVDIGGKGVGIADQASIDLNKGCSNDCAGCYAAKTSRLGHKFGTVEVKEYDDSEFRKSCRAAVKKSITVVRFGKHTDNGLDVCAGNCKRVIDVATEESIRLVFVTKSLGYDTEISKALRDGDHVLHISMGMITDAPSEIHRMNVFNNYRRDGVQCFYRIIEDVTKPLPLEYASLAADKCIITPMRFPSKDTALITYGADLSKYKFTGGFYRPTEIHKSWNKFKNWCGEVGEQVKCCNCKVI